MPLLRIIFKKNLPIERMCLIELCVQFNILHSCSSRGHVVFLISFFPFFATQLPATCCRNSFPISRQEVNLVCYLTFMPLSPNSPTCWKDSKSILQILGCKVFKLVCVSETFCKGMTCQFNLLWISII